MPNSTSSESPSRDRVDVVLIGGGIMSATLGTFISQLEPDWKIELFERLDSVAQESSNGLNNAGTGHSALAEMNYTPENQNGEIDITKAINIDEQFQLSRQFWAYLVRSGLISDPNSFINSVPHFSFVWGEKNVQFLRKRYLAMTTSPLFEGMEYSEDHNTIKNWLPLVMKGRDPSQPVGATRMVLGTDVNFGALTRQMVQMLLQHDSFKLNLGHEVCELNRTDDGWQVTVAERHNKHKRRTIYAKHVFIGAGGASLKLLQKSGIPEARQYGGFPVGGQFLVTDNQELVRQHQAKVYGKAAIGAPPMSVPHLDTRVIDGKHLLLFGPFASFSSKFLKSGSLWDLFGSLNLSNLSPMVQVGLRNFDLVRYLIGQLCQSNNARYRALKEFFPQAKAEDWKLWQAGQRVQIIKKEPGQSGQLRFGTELICDEKGSLSALLGASPGASTSAAIMLQLLERCFADQFASERWQSKIKTMIPSYGVSLNDNAKINERELQLTGKILQLTAQFDDEAIPNAIKMWQEGERRTGSLSM
ncbi:malate dehydrogenase (quinone) [Celerinatantimonas diazotrophica]|uniref:Probable malate:quinone oxidoreductase n=1 Tax=Celerinatantimonas diazotrophica TaxID=412034 RepID=A0A4R1KF96_9GAMM|nr:malate dehydrogenase (quinone) [Celerinatantimonas diazotrophica]TCK63294.1 malate dehydrogenase (quinone) [Celerinatantimonas diazotrophica]CAG9298438.1 Malate:quinone oxidoreductase [Celerinatantimonas diazotrophica]